MITIFNRREAFVAYDMDTYLNARDILQQAGIKCISRIKGTVSSKRKDKSLAFGRGGMDNSTQYYLYVNRKDSEKAKHIINVNRDTIYNK